MFKKYFLLIISSAFVILSFNNCSFNSPFNSTMLDMGSNITPPPGEETDRVIGERLYSLNCAGCHGNLEVSTKLNRTAAEITTAISVQGQMKYLSFLTADDISKIALALSPKDVPPDQPEVKMASSTEVRVGNRYFVTSNLKEVFVADSGTDQSDRDILKVLDTNVMTHPEAFGGNCSRYDANCVKICGLKGSDPCEADHSVKINSAATPSSSVLRKGYTTRTCEEILSIDKSILTALTKAEVKTDLQPNPLPNQANISLFMSYYYMNKPITQVAVDELLKLVEEAKGKGMNTNDQWRFVMLPICESSFGDLL